MLRGSDVKSWKSSISEGRGGEGKADISAPWLLQTPRRICGLFAGHNDRYRRE